MENPTDRVVLPSAKTERLLFISEKHRAALATLRGMDLPSDAMQQIYILSQSYLALHNEYCDLNITLLEIAAKVKEAAAIRAEMNESNPPS
jgi:hypothetical protein